MIISLVQERLNKITDSEHLKHCGDLLEQLKFLVEETRGQRFVVNINVPSQVQNFSIKLYIFFIKGNSL